jgi:hypothetical protein
MTKTTKKLLENRGVGVAKQVAARRLRLSGMKLEGKLRFAKIKVAKKHRLPDRLVKRLAGV